VESGEETERRFVATVATDILETEDQHGDDAAIKCACAYNTIQELHTRYGSANCSPTRWIFKLPHWRGTADRRIASQQQTIDVLNWISVARKYTDNVMVGMGRVTPRIHYLGEVLVQVIVEHGREVRECGWHICCASGSQQEVNHADGCRAFSASYR